MRPSRLIAITAAVGLVLGAGPTPSATAQGNGGGAVQATIGFAPPIAGLGPICAPNTALAIAGQAEGAVADPAAGVEWAGTANLWGGGNGCESVSAGAGNFVINVVGVLGAGTLNCQGLAGNYQHVGAVVVFAIGGQCNISGHVSQVLMQGAGTLTANSLPPIATAGLVGTFAG